MTQEDNAKNVQVDFVYWKLTPTHRPNVAGGLVVGLIYRRTITAVDRNENERLRSNEVG
jgi:hypothetical protein